jgi:hypothetical protein
LGFKKNRVLVYDDNLSDGNPKHIFNEYKISENGDLIEYEIIKPSKKDIAVSVIMADLMSVGCIISSSIQDLDNYDFIFEQKYQKGRSLFQDQEEFIGSRARFYKVKVISGNVRNGMIDFSSNEIDISDKVDYYGLYCQETDKSYLIPVQKIWDNYLTADFYQISEKNKIMDKMNKNDLGETNEMRIAAEFMKNKINVFTPFIGNEKYDLVIKKNEKYRTIQVKTGRTYYEKDSTYVRFEASTRKSSYDQSRIDYKEDIDFFAVINQDTSKKYIVPTQYISSTDGKLKLDHKNVMRSIHHGTIWAKNQKFQYLNEIFEDYVNEGKRKKEIDKEIQSMYQKPLKIQSELEIEQIFKLLRGDLRFNDIISTNKILKVYCDNFKKFNPNSLFEYQGIITVDFRDFLVDEQSIKSKILKKMKKDGLYDESKNRTHFVYNYIGRFIRERKKEPSTLHLYQKFLNFKTYELRGILDRVRKRVPK